MVAEPVTQMDARHLAEEVSALASRLSVTKLMSALDYLRYLSEGDEWYEQLDPMTEAETARFRAGDISGLKTLEEVRKEPADLP